MLATIQADIHVPNTNVLGTIILVKKPRRMLAGQQHPKQRITKTFVLAKTSRVRKAYGILSRVQHTLRERPVD